VANATAAATVTALAATNANTLVVVSGQAALNSLITTSQPGVFDGANVTINLEEQNFTTTNQVTSTINSPSGSTGEIQYNSGANSFASDAYFTYTNSNVVTPGIRTNGYFYGNGAPFTAGGNAAIGNFVFSGDTVTISDANQAMSITGNGTGNIRVNSNGNIWTFNNAGNLTLPSNTSSINYANGSPYGTSGNYSNANVASFLAAFGSNVVSTTGNITSGNIVATEANVTDVIAYNVTTVNIFARDASGINLGANGYNNLVVLETDVLVQNVPLSVTGNITAGNLDAVNLVINSIRSDDSTFVTIEDGVNVTSGLISAPGNIELTAGANTWTFGANGNLNTSGNITGVNLIVANILSATGSIQSSNITAGTLSAIGNIIANNASITNIVSGANLQVSGTANVGALSTVGSVSANGNITTLSAMYAGNGATWQTEASFPNILFLAADVGNEYVQAAIVETGGNASADWVSYSNNGNTDSGWIDMGITGNTFNDPEYELTDPNDGYILVQGTNVSGTPIGGNLILATGATGLAHDIVFATGGFAQANIKARLYDSTGEFSVVGNIAANNIVTNSIRSDDSTFVTIEDGINVTSGLISAPGSMLLTAGAQTFTLDTNGILTLPGNSRVAPVGANIEIQAAAGGYAEIVTSNGNSYVAVTNGGAEIVTSGIYNWDFDNGGNLTLPNGAVIKDTAGNAIAFGNSAGNTSQGINAIAIGASAGFLTQGNSAVAIGQTAGNSTQGEYSAAFGYGAGANAQGLQAVAIGSNAGAESQRNTAVAIGAGAGFDNQGNSAVAIGYFAGQSAQGNNSIIINATGAALNALTANTFTVAPVRNDVANIAEVVFYNTTTKEITYGNVISVAGNITGNYFIGNGSQLTSVAVPSQTILPTIQSITAVARSAGLFGGGQGGANVTVANTIPVTEYGVIITDGTTSETYKTGALGSIPGTVSLTFTTGLNSTQYTLFAYVTSNAGTYYSNAVTGTSGICLLAGTQIALSDGTHKAIEDITYTDKLLSWDFDRGCYAETTAMWIKRSETGSQYNLLTFSDGTTLRTFDQHRIFNKQAGAFTYPMTAATPVGTVTVNEHGQEITLTNKQVIQDTIEYYNVITDYHMNLFSDSVLTSCRFNNIYPIVDMKFAKDGRTPRTRAEFENVEDRFFHGLRLAEQTADIETVEWYVNRLLSTEVSTPAELAV
jgi:hypothetical protein